MLISPAAALTAQEILSHSVSDLELEQACEGIDAGNLLMVIDACNSGQALEAQEKRRGPMNSKGLAQLAYEKGMYILTAAQSYQAAMETEQLGHGYLTYALVEEGLKSAAADGEPKDGQVVLHEWLDYATDRVPRMQEAKDEGGARAHAQGRFRGRRGKGGGRGQTKRATSSGLLSPRTGNSADGCRQTVAHGSESRVYIEDIEQESH